MSEQEIHDICKKYNITNYTINSDESIDVNGNVILCGKRLNKLPLKFNKVSGYFDCSDNFLTSLVNSPIVINEWFDSSRNKLSSLDNSPENVFGSVLYEYNNLINLKGIGKISGYIFCKDNPLESLEGYNGNYDKLRCDNKDRLIRKTKLKIIEHL